MTSSALSIRRLALADMDAAARVHRAAFDHAPPGLADRRQLWTFQRNARARRFYEARGFVAVEQTDGSRNEEQEPDVRYLWTRVAAS
ncbi:hypothetical protein [uncultured Bradyrhizobium sp.]|uniref:hypothetical protein n=1 Tax=uncultured Bradyrhizobium sp. TaxID=199684 RepID=UPI0026396FBE|nr:hypothetical protein [uncultured Bradyrhizobium sp.]